MKTQLPPLLLFLLVPTLWRTPRSSPAQSVSDHKKTSLHWLVNPLPLALLLPTALNFFGLTALLLSTPQLHTRFLPHLVFSNSK